MFGKFLLPVRKNKGHFAIKLHGYMKGNNFKHLNMKTKESTDVRQACSLEKKLSILWVSLPHMNGIKQ